MAGSKEEPTKVRECKTLKTLKEVCKDLDVRFLRKPPLDGKFQYGDTLAQMNLGKALRANGIEIFRRSISLVMAAKITPIPGNLIRALADVISKPEFQEVDDSILIALIPKVLGDHVKIVKIVNSSRIPNWKATSLYIQNNLRRQVWF